MKNLLKIFVFLSLYCGLVISSESEDIRRRGPHYLFTSPKTLTSGQNETVCLSLYDALTPAKVLVDLKIKDKHHVTAHTLHSEHECFEISIPKLRHHIMDAQFASLHLQVQLNGTVHSGHNQDPLLIYPNHNVIFIETDKSLYKPNDKVKIRILILTQDLKAPYSYIIPIIKILNPMGITITVWENIPTELGLVQLEHQLAHDTTMGKWKIELNDISKTFHVQEYVLPRFIAVLQNPRTIFAASNVTKFTVCGKYAYGENVKGIGLIKISFSKHNRKAINNAKELKNGCAIFDFSNDDLHLREQVNSDIHITATVTELSTSRVETDTGKSHVTHQAYTLRFVDDNKYFQPGLPYHGKLKATDSLVPLVGEIIEICYNVAVDKIWNIKDINQCSNFSFGHDDSVYFYVLPVKDSVIQIRLYARSLNQTVKQAWIGNVYPNKNEEVNAYFTLNRWYSPTNSYIQLDRTNKMHSKCKAAQQFTVYYTTGKLKEQDITFHYMLKSRNKILKIRSIAHTTRKQHIFDQNELNNVVGKNHTYTKIETFVDKYILKFKLDPRVISKYQLIVYYTLPNGEAVAASLDVNVEKCLLNKVETTWSNHQYYPGERAIATIKTAENSLCAVSAVDKSVTFSSNSKPLNIHSLLRPFLIERATRRSNKLHCLSHAHKQLAATLPETTTTEQPEWDLRRRRRKRYYGMSMSNQFDAYEAFNNFGVSVISNLKLITKPCTQDETASPSTYQSYDVPDSGVQFLTNPNKDLYYDVHAEDRGISIRSFFPETWLWELVPVGAHETRVSRDLPHTITNWVSNTLCVSPVLGVGLSQQTEITVFQPFFLEVLTPHSIKRGEMLYLEVMLFNYLNYSIPVRITLGDSEGLELPGHPDERSEIHCIFAQDSKTVIFRLQGTQLGKLIIRVLAEVESSYPGECGPEVIINKRDMVIKEVLVQAEGHPVDDVKSILLCTDDSKSANNISWNLQLPDEVIADSAKAKLIINADLLGPTIHNLEKLLVVPTGCGEQIMATLAPNLYILEYLKATGKLTPALQQRARRNLKIGYQRILEYVHKDGSFSAFGYHDPAGSMFLTAFVVRTLQQSKAYIYIDQNVIDRAVRWIIENQLENGCFATISHVFHDMGGASTENSTAALTSYVLISLLESGIQLTETVRTNAKYCIRGHFSPDKYTLALSTYALSLVQWESEASRSLHRLLQVATQEDNLMWWSTPGSVATNIEMTSYVLMSLLHQNTSENLVHANSVVRWLVSQRGPNGGFITTQDTVVALNAITKYALLVRTKDANLRVNITADNEEYEVTINAKDRLKTKQQIIKELPNNVDVMIEGKGCVLVQAHVHYNLDHVTSSEAFKLAVDVDPVSTTDQCSVAMVSPCISYTGPGLHSNMAILEVTMPSGYEPDRASLFKLVEESNSKVKKFEESENQVILYFTELNNEPICVPFNINENSEVDARVDANVKLYDYYNPELQVSTTYKVNKCQPNEIAPIPLLPVNKKINNLTNDYIPAENTTDNNTINESKNSYDEVDIQANTQNIVKRHAKQKNSKKTYNTGLNPDFVNMDVEMAMPEGSEGNIPIYTKPKKEEINGNG